VPYAAAPAASPAAVPAPSPPPVPIAPLSCAACRKIAFTSSRDGNDNIYTVNADGTGLTRLTYDAASHDHAAWSRDGNRLAFTSRTGDDIDLIVMNADGSGIIRHTSLPESVYDPAWSADGTKIAYSARSDGSMNLWTVAANGGYPLLLHSASSWDMQPAWSPDGRKIAFASDWFGYEFAIDVFVVDSAGVGFTPLTDGNIFDRLDYLWPSWSPDGSKIATTIQWEPVPNQVSAFLGVMNADGSQLTPLIAAAPWSKSTWSSDGSTIAFTSGNSTAHDIAWIKSDGSARGTIITAGRNPAWQP
jgi:Tol biopolymer transport system component